MWIGTGSYIMGPPEDEPLSWNRLSDGSLLLAEAEWEHTCRVGNTSSPRYGQADHGRFGPPPVCAALSHIRPDLQFIVALEGLEDDLSLGSSVQTNCRVPPRTFHQRVLAIPVPDSGIIGAGGSDAALRSEYLGKGPVSPLAI